MHRCLHGQRCLYTPTCSPFYCVQLPPDCWTLQSPSLDSPAACVFSYSLLTNSLSLIFQISFCSDFPLLSACCSVCVSFKVHAGPACCTWFLGQHVQVQNHSSGRSCSSRPQLPPSARAQASLAQHTHCRLLSSPQAAPPPNLDLQSAPPPARQPKAETSWGHPLPPIHSRVCPSCPQGSGVPASLPCSAGTQLASPAPFSSPLGIQPAGPVAGHCKERPHFWHLP